MRAGSTRRSCVSGTTAAVYDVRPRFELPGQLRGDIPSRRGHAVLRGQDLLLLLPNGLDLSPVTDPAVATHRGAERKGSNPF